MALALVSAMPPGPEDGGSAFAAHGGGDRGKADELADAAVAVWQQVDTALSPVIGKHAVLALLQRSLHLARRRRPSLEAVCQELQPIPSCMALRGILLLQASAEIPLVHAELLQIFRDLVERLVGPSLTERLLYPVLRSSAGDAGAPDTSS